MYSGYTKSIDDYASGLVENLHICKQMIPELFYKITSFLPFAMMFTSWTLHCKIFACKLCLSYNCFDILFSSSSLTFINVA